MKEFKTTGTRQWSKHSANLYNGCKNNCRYCYARANAMRFGTIKNRSEWPSMELRSRIQEKYFRKVKGRIMFPTSHDIFPETLDTTMEFLARVIAAGNDVLITTKPRLRCMQTICNNFRNYPEKAQITFRFSIGSMDENILSFWEPNAPPFSERVVSLAYAWHLGFRTSVSCEPFLDDNVLELYEIISGYITDSFWIGKMNRINQRVSFKGWSKDDWKFFQLLQHTHKDDYIKKLYATMKDLPFVKWKDSIETVIGLEHETENTDEEN